MTLEDLKQARKDYGCSYRQIADLSGVPVSTVQKVFDGTTKTPRYQTLQALSEAIRTLTGEGQNSYFSEKTGKPHYVREQAQAYGSKKQGDYTIEDYFNLPDDQRAELIDGVFYDMAAPLVIHQGMLGELYIAFRNACAAHHIGQCKIFLAPCGVQLDMDERTVVEPDLFILCDPSKLKRRTIFGAPDFVLEILSPSTRRKDMFLKTQKYEEAGVREYWMVDIENRRIIVYVFADPACPVIYTFHDRVPISISEGSCEIDFKEIWAALKDLPL